MAFRTYARLLGSISWDPLMVTPLTFVRGHGYYCHFTNAKSRYITYNVLLEVSYYDCITRNHTLRHQNCQEGLLERFCRSHDAHQPQQHSALGDAPNCRCTFLTFVQWYSLVRRVRSVEVSTKSAPHFCQNSPNILIQGSFPNFPFIRSNLFRLCSNCFSLIQERPVKSI